jgi:DNA-3-methyladenine glycosylase II
MAEYFIYGETEIAHLKKRDKKLGAAIDAIGPIRREITPDLFQALVYSIVAQQIASKAARTVRARLGERIGLTPALLAAVPAEHIQQCGMSLRKAGYIKGIADAVRGGELDLAALAHLPDREVVARLAALNGIGVWTAEMLLLFCLRRPDVVSWGDLAIRRGMMRLYNLRDLNREQFERRRKRYAPYGSVASLYLWALSG